MERKIDDKFTKPYNPSEVEDKIYEKWEKSGFFNPDKLPTENGDSRFCFKDISGNDNVFSMVLPPPNVTGTLHMGSALMLAIEDIMVRYARMTGKKTLWVPGTDHAAIATQAKVEKEIQKKEGKSRHDLGREELLKRIDAFAKESHDGIVVQMRKMGCSIDWSREAFTLDEKRNLAVKTAFKKMFDDGLVYRGLRVVNWDPKGQTTISDDEIEYETRKTKLYTFKYSKDIPISISTTRPETKLGDTAIAIHPDDSRYSKYVGKEFKAVFAGEPITLKVIADIGVEKEFGTGALGVTPAHSSIDWEMAQKNNLPLKQVINEFARMTLGFDEKTAPDKSMVIKDKKVAEAREAVVSWLKSQGLLEKEEEIEHNIALAQRTGGVVEPLPKLQWFVAVNKKFKFKKSSRAEKAGGKNDSDILGIKDGQEITLKELMMATVNSGATKIIPDRFVNVYYNWINNLRDWCISRQIWYGHRIPVWYKTGVGGAAETGDESAEIFCDINPPKGKGWIQDEDTLDTWFSSGLWTFSTLGWPDHSETAKAGESGPKNDFANYHPTAILETGWDILFFWIARMILMSGYLVGEVPFKNVYLHGLVRDSSGGKISKSSGHNIEPLDVIKKYGADAVRMALVVNVGPGNDSKINDDKIKAYKLFSNKLWNITRFILSSIGDMEYSGVGPIDGAGLFNEPSLNDADKALAKELSDLLKDITSDMDNYRYYMAGEKLYQYAWHRLADVILEESKPIIGISFQNGEMIIKDVDQTTKKSRQQFLLSALVKLVSALHPFMPYVTEEIWSSLPIKNRELLMISEWPK
jgi:valyl-tRNA synthetase